MKKTSKFLVLLLAIMVLFASCDPGTETEDKKPGLPAPDTTIDTTAVKRLDVDPAHPYDALHYGLFDEQVYTSTSTPKGDEVAYTKTTSKYSIFIPKNGQPKIPTIIVLTPNNTTAAEFARTETGIEWIEASAKEGRFAVAFAEPLDGKEWNISGDPTKRDEKAFAHDMFTSVRLKEITDNAFINVDKNTVALVGYDEGAVMAAFLAADWPQMFPNVTCIRPTGITTPVVKQINELLDLKTYPHNSEYTAGSSNFGNVTAREIAMPMYVINSDVEEVENIRVKGVPTEVKFYSGDRIVEIWKDVNENALKEDSSADLDLYVAKTLPKETTVEEIAELAIANGRFRGYRGGTLRHNTNMYVDKGYKVYNEAICKDLEGAEDPRIRRWATYIPEGLPENENVPLVVVLHGSTAAITDIVDESKWSDVADDNKFIVVYCQGYPGSKGTHAPGWSSQKDDINFITEVVKRVSKENKIDPERIYLTGHSLGAMMLQALMNNKEAAEVFAAFAPVGSFSKPNMKGELDWKKEPVIPTPTDVEMPVYGLLGEWEFEGWKLSGEQVGLEWAKRFGIDTTPTPEMLTGYHENKYKVWNFNDNEGHPVVKAMQVMDSPHVYMAEQSEIIWDWFKGIKRDATSKKTVFADQN